MSRRLTDAEWDDVCDLARNAVDKGLGTTYTELAEMFGVSPSSISRGLKNRGIALKNRRCQHPLRARSYSIPLAGGATAVVLIPPKITDNDIERIKGWFDVMRDVLTESDR